MRQINWKTLRAHFNVRRTVHEYACVVKCDSNPTCLSAYHTCCLYQNDWSFWKPNLTLCWNL